MKFVLAILIAVGIFLIWKKTEWKKVLKIILTVVLGLVMIGCLLPSSSDDAKKTDDKSTTKQEETVDEDKAVEYTDVTADELCEALDSNAASASDTYKDKYFAVTGKLSTIDSDGSYIGLAAMDEDSFYLVDIQCFIKSDEQFEKVKTLKKGDTITVRGKITDVGEILGYSLDIDSID